MMIGRFKCAVAVSLLVAVQIASTKNNKKVRDTTQQEVDVVHTQEVVEGRGHVIKMLDLGSMVEGNRADAIALTDDVSGVLSSGVALLILSLWITLLFHLYQAGFERRSEPDYSHYFQQNPYNRYYGNRQKSGSITERMSRLLDNISSNSIKRIVDSLDPRPSISRIGEGAVNSVEGIVIGTLDQGASIVSQATEVVSLAGDLFNGGASRVSKSVEQISAKDCLLQSMCYLSAPDTAPLIRRMLDTSDKFEGRRKKNKKNKEHKKNKKNKKKNKNKVKIEYYDDDDIFGDEDEDEKEEKDEEEDEENEELAQKDCEVFRCTPVRLGHGLYQLYNKIQEINSFSSNSIDDY